MSKLLSTVVPERDMRVPRTSMARRVIVVARGQFVPHKGYACHQDAPVCSPYEDHESPC